MSENNNTNNEIFGNLPLDLNNENIFGNNENLGINQELDGLGGVGGDFFGGNNIFEQKDEVKKDTKRPSLVQKPTDKAKIILSVIFATFIIGVIFGGVFLHNMFKSVGVSIQTQASSTGTTTTTNLSTNTTKGNTFGGNELTGEYNQEQLSVLKKVEKGETLTTAENLLLQKMIFKNVEVKTIIRSQYKSYFGN